MIKSNNKFRAVNCFYNQKTGKVTRTRSAISDLKFDSLFEANVYRQLVKVFPEKFISRQVRLLIKPETKIYPAKYWRCDFAITHPRHATVQYVEAKGALTREFVANLQYVECFNQAAYASLIIVASGDTRVEAGKFSMISLDKLAQALQLFHSSGKPTSTTGK